MPYPTPKRAKIQRRYECIMEHRPVHRRAMIQRKLCVTDQPVQQVIHNVQEQPELVLRETSPRTTSGPGIQANGQLRPCPRSLPNW